MSLLNYFSLGRGGGGGAFVKLCKEQRDTLSKVFTIAKYCEPFSDIQGIKLLERFSPVVQIQMKRLTFNSNQTKI